MGKTLTFFLSAAKASSSAASDTDNVPAGLDMTEICVIECFELRGEVYDNQVKFDDWAKIALYYRFEGYAQAKNIQNLLERQTCEGRDC